MKAKKKRKNLEMAQKWYDAQPNNFKAATTRPGSMKQRTLTGAK